MRSLLIPLFLTGLVGFVVADLSLSPYVVHERRNHVPAGWSHSRKHHSTSVLPLRFGLAQPNIHAIGDFLNDIAHPDSSNYGNHWTPQQVAEKFAPSDDTVETVKHWLLENGFSAERIRITGTKGWIEVNATVEEAEHLLKTEYHVYKHTSGKEHVSCESYHLPSHVTHHVDLVTPTVHFNAIISRSPEPVLEARDSTSVPANKISIPHLGFQGPKTFGPISTILKGLKDCDKQMTPACLRALYGVVGVPVAAKKNSFAIVEYTPQAYVPSDIDNFAKSFDPLLSGKRPQLVSIDGGVVQTSQQGYAFNAESNLDLQYSMSLVTPLQEVSLYQVGDAFIGASFNNLLDALDRSYCTFEGGNDPQIDKKYPDSAPGGYQKGPDCGTVKPANVVSTSYSFNEANVTPAYIARQCAEYGKLGLLGVTVLFSSGDNGVGGNGQVCLNADGTEAAHGKLFNPTFPAGCPYITSVGATQVNPGSSIAEPESACEQNMASGGGFSNHFALPDYQKEVVPGYMKNIPSSLHGLYNGTGHSRGYPDLSANGARYVVSIQGQFILVGGTSASTPVVGAILTLVNDARLAVGKKPIGFINPTIYSPKFDGAFHDITSGSNPGCGTQGFEATSGWDPVTGLGTPNFPELVKRWLELP